MPLIVVIIVLCPTKFKLSPTKIVNWSDMCPVKKKYLFAALGHPSSYNHVRPGLTWKLSGESNPLTAYANLTICTLQLQSCLLITINCTLLCILKLNCVYQISPRALTRFFPLKILNVWLCKCHQM